MNQGHYCLAAYSRQRMHGVALITALLVVAIAVTAAIGMSVRDHTQIQRASLLLEQDHARNLLRGAETMAVRLLEQWGDFSELPWEEGCVSPDVPLSIDGIIVIARLENLHCRFNLNSLGRTEDPPISDFANLLTQAGLAQDVTIPRWEGEQLAIAIRDWMDPETDDPAYRLRNPPERSGNRPFVFASELNGILGMRPEIWTAIAPWVIALPVQDHWIDRTHAPELITNATTPTGTSQDNSARFFRLELAAQLPQRDFFHCAMLDAPNGLIVLREQTTCEP